MPPPPDRQTMVARQLRARDISDERVLEAMERVPRELFVPENDRDHAYADAALPIGHGQTISQPYMVARIAEALALRPGERVLDERARASLAAAGYPQVDVRIGDGTLGVPELAPFDAIAVAAAAPAFPETLYEQLRPRGRLVVPVGGEHMQRLEVIVRSPEGPAVVHSVPCRFVPLVGREGFAD
jgi:protein-L-isoaspartate(D-aspartate) O-methyltransferase